MATITVLKETMAMKELVDALNDNFKNSNENNLKQFQLLHQTISDNAVIVNNNFVEVKKEFAKLERKMDKGFKKIDTKLDTILDILNKK